MRFVIAEERNGLRWIAAASCAATLWLGTLGMANAEPAEPVKGPDEITAPLRTRPWDLSLRLSFGRDTNVPQGPDITTFSGSNNSYFAGASLVGSYGLVNTPYWSAGVMGTADFVQYSEGKSSSQGGSSEQTTTSLLNPGAFARRKLRLGILPASLGVIYDHRREQLPLDGGDLTSDTVKIDSGISLSRKFRLGALAAYSLDDYSVTPADPRLDGRDGERKSYGMSASYRFPWHQTSASLAYMRSENNADGRNFDYEGSRLSGRIETHIKGPLWLGLELAQETRDFKHYQSNATASQAATSQDIVEFGGQLRWEFNRTWQADLFVKHSVYASDQAALDAERWNFGVGLTYRF